MSDGETGDHLGDAYDRNLEWCVYRLFPPFIDEHPDIYVTIEGDEKKHRESITIESGAMKGKGLKYHKINEMLSVIHSDKVYDLMEQFDRTEYMIEKSMEPWL